MSIVETALSLAKSQRDELRERNAPRQLDRSGERRAPADLDPRNIPQEPRVHVATPRIRVPIDVEQIRAEGMLAVGGGAQRCVDEIRRVKWPLLASAFGQGVTRAERGNLLLVTSAVPGEGKSFVSLNLALNIAAGGTDVLLVDADAAKARISRVCGLRDRAGLSELLQNETMGLEEVVVDTGIPHLHMLPAGRGVALSAELLSSRRAEDVLNQLAGESRDRIVVIDSAPLLATNEAQVLSRLTGQVLMVVRADTTPKSAVLEAVKLLDRRQLIRAVINQVRSGIFGDGYGQYYYAYGSERE